MLYIKYLHIFTALTSGLFFVVRGFWMLSESEQLAKKWVKVLPHIIDTLLLASAIYLMIKIQQYPFQAAWITAKVLALIAYIVFGTIALKRGKTRTIRLQALLVSIGLFIYMLGVAKWHNPWSWFSPMLSM